jgi:hypothetical protein
MRAIALAAALVVSAVVAGTAPALAASSCDITDLSCWGPGKKCNIKFRNKTGLAGGSAAGEHNQISRAATLRVSARKSNGNKAGSNVISITAGDNKTLNLDKKKDFVEIRLRSDSAQAVTMSCDDIRATLKGSGKCDVFAASSSRLDPLAFRYYLAYKCAGGDVVSSRPTKWDKSDY